MPFQRWNNHWLLSQGRDVSIENAKLRSCFSTVLEATAKRLLTPTDSVDYQTFCTLLCLSVKGEELTDGGRGCGMWVGAGGWGYTGTFPLMKCQSSRSFPECRQNISTDLCEQIYVCSSVGWLDTFSVGFLCHLREDCYDFNAVWCVSFTVSKIA